MKKILTVCIMLAAIVFLAYAGTEAGKIVVSKDRTIESVTPVSKTMAAPDPVKVSRMAETVLSPAEEIDFLTKQIFEAKANGMEPNPAWQARIDELDPPARSNPRSLDQGGEAWANATVVSSIPYTDSGTLGSNIEDCTGRPYNDVFYVLNVTLAGNYVFDMCNSTGDTYLKWYKNPSAACTATLTGTADDECGSSDPKTGNIALVVGDVVYIECGNWTSTATPGAYNFNVAGPTLAPGRCCYGTDPCNPVCVVNLQSECTALGGTWTINGDCSGTSPCPVPQAGEVCCNALALPVPGTVSGNNSTFVNNYNTGAFSCTEGTGTGGKDVVYVFTAAADMEVTFNMCTGTTAYDAKMFIFEDVCGNIIACREDGCANPPLYTSTFIPKIECLPVYAGHVYYVVVSGYGSSSTGNYTLETTICAADPMGACCYNDGANCSDMLESECAAMSGTFMGAGTICANIVCPTPCPYPNLDVEPNDVCADAQEVFCREAYCGELLTSADIDYYEFIIRENDCQSLTINVYADGTAGQWPYGMGCDPWVGVYAVDCTTLLYSDEDGGEVYDSYIALTGCLEPGTYYLAVKTNYAGPGPYVLDIACTSCVCPGTTDCSTFELCGNPGEIEPNDACPAGHGQIAIGCDMTVYGLHCLEADHDYWEVVVPPANRMVLTVFEGEACDVNPTVALKTDIYGPDCVKLNTTASTTAWNLTNSGTEPWVVYVDVYGTTITTYKIVTTCCPIVDYLANPIVIDVPSSSFEQTVNTCCATNPIANICGYASGPDVLFYHCGAGTWTFTASGPGDEQLIVFDADFNILGCADDLVLVGDETVTLTIGEICWYVGVSLYGAGSCGDITLTIEGDTWLPVELTSFDAVSSDRAVTLNWATASENDNDYYRVLRSGEIVGEVNASGTVTGGTYTYTDNGLTNGTSYDYSVVAVSMSGEVEEVFAISATPSFAAATISEYALHQNFPNPFNPETKITFDLVDAGFVTLSVYNLLGQEVSTLVNSSMDAGRHIVSFDANNLPSGLYLYRMEVNGFSAQKKMVLMK